MHSLVSLCSVFIKFAPVYSLFLYLWTSSPSMYSYVLSYIISFNLPMSLVPAIQLISEPFGSVQSATSTCFGLIYSSIISISYNTLSASEPCRIFSGSRHHSCSINYQPTKFSNSNKHSCASWPQSLVIVFFGVYQVYCIFLSRVYLNFSCFSFFPISLLSRKCVFMLDFPWFIFFFSNFKFLIFFFF